MINKFFESLEDPTRPLMAPNYWILEKTGVLLPKEKINKFCCILVHGIVTLFVVTECIELYLIRSNLDLVLSNLKISMVSVVCIVKVQTYILWQKSWKDVLEYVNEADKFERENADVIKGQIINTYTKYCRRITYFYWILLFTTFLTTISEPLMRYMSSSVVREQFLNGTEEFPHIFSSWMPFDKNDSPGCWVTLVVHTVFCFYGVAVIASYDTSVVVIIVFFGGKLNLLRERCKQMFGDGHVIVSDDEAAKVIRELHKIHVMLIKYSRLFNSLLSPVMFVYMVMCSVMICASAYQVTSNKSAAEKLLMAEYLLFGIAQLFAFCWHSNDVLEKNENVSYGAFESNWWTANLQHKKNVVILCGQLRIINVFTAGPFTNLTLATFITILKGAYSFYTLLRE